MPPLRPIENMLEIHKRFKLEGTRSGNHVSRQGGYVIFWRETTLAAETTFRHYDPLKTCFEFANGSNRR